MHYAGYFGNEHNIISMKITTLFITFVLLSTFCYAQNNLALRINIITESEFSSITFNGKTITEIEATLGNDDELLNTFGSYTSKEKSDSGSYVTFNYGTTRVNYSYEFTRLVSLVITDNSWPVVVQGKTIQVGNSVQDLKNKFGNDFMIFSSEYVSYLHTGFTYSGNDYNSVSLEINPETELISEITYYIIP